MDIDNVEKQKQESSLLVTPGHLITQDPEFMRQVSTSKTL